MPGKMNAFLMNAFENKYKKFHIFFFCCTAVINVATPSEQTCVYKESLTNFHFQLCGKLQYEYNITLPHSIIANTFSKKHSCSKKKKEQKTYGLQKPTTHALLHEILKLSTL